MCLFVAKANNALVPPFLVQNSLSSANVNIRLIAQGSSERQIAVVVSASDTSRALRAAHMSFTLSETTASIGVLGCTGDIGSALVKQLKEQKQRLADKMGVAMCVSLAASSRNMALGENGVGVDLDTLQDKMMQGDETVAFDLDDVSDAMMKDVHPLRVIIDCTNSEDVSEYYERWISAGISIISPSRKLASGCLVGIYSLLLQDWLPFHDTYFFVLFFENNRTVTRG